MEIKKNKINVKENKIKNKIINEPTSKINLNYRCIILLFYFWVFNFFIIDPIIAAEYMYMLTCFFSLSCSGTTKFVYRLQ